MGMKYTTIKQFQKIKRELGVDDDVKGVIARFIGLKWPLTNARVVVFKLNREFHGRYQTPASERSLYLIWNRWDRRYGRNLYSWRHCNIVQSDGKDEGLYERIVTARYKNNDWIPLYAGDRCTPTFYDRIVYPLRSMDQRNLDFIRKRHGYVGFDPKFAYGSVHRWSDNAIPAHFTEWGNNDDDPLVPQRRFYHGLDNVNEELKWLARFKHYIRRIQQRDDSQAIALYDSVVLARFADFINQDWHGFYTRYDISPGFMWAGSDSEWGM